MATLLMRPTDGGSADKKRRSRKTKSTQKKLPQRGLGVAQLEKLRLQEQSLLCSQPSYALRLCSTADHPGMARCDSDVAQTILSLTNAQAVGCSSTVVRVGEACSGPRLTLIGHSGAQSLSPSVVQDVTCSSNVESVDPKRAIAPRAIPCLSQQSPKFSSCNAPFFSNVLATPQLHMFDAQTQQAQIVEERRASEAGHGPTYIFPITNNVKEAVNHVHDGGFIVRPMFKSHAQRIPFNVSDAPYLETLIGPDVPHLPRKRIELPVVGLPPSVDRTKELSSFQSYPSQQAWSTPDKNSGRKRPWFAFQDSQRQVAQGQALDLNAPAGENDVVGYNRSDRQSPRLNDTSENRAGAHYTTGIVRSALGNSSCSPLAKTNSVCSSGSPWQESCDSFSVSNYFPDVGGVYAGNGIVVRQCVSQFSVKDRCSSATGSTTCFTLNQKRCPSDQGPSLLSEKDSISSNFLTLGISSSSYPSCQSWNDTEHDNSHNTRDNSPVSSNDVRRLKNVSATNRSEGDDHGSQIRKPCSQQFPGPKVCQLLSIAIDTRRRTRLCISYHRDFALSRTMANAVMHYIRFFLVENFKWTTSIHLFMGPRR